MKLKLNHIDKERATIRFVGDSGDGMQLTGSRFSAAAALFGNDLATFPDFPAEIRAPAGTLEGVSGYQVQIGGGRVHTPGDQVDVLAALNPAALKSSLAQVRKGGTLIINTDSFDKPHLTKVGFAENPLENDTLQEYHVLRVPATSLTNKALEGLSLDNKRRSQCKNMLILGIVYWLFDRTPNQTEKHLEKLFRDKPLLAQANIRALYAGYHFAETIEASPALYNVPRAAHAPGRYRHISGNTATAWGLMAAAEKINKKLFFSSYPITPASPILHELAKRKDMGVIVLQAEDEIAAICSAIGASYAGELGVTASSGPGIALKGEALGLAVMAELPLVVVDVQRGGPSTGLPTKTEQADMNLALYGRNGESPVAVVAASTPSDCFDMAYRAAKIAVEHATPVILLTDGYLANGATPWRFPNTESLPPIVAPKLLAQGEPYMPYRRDPETLARQCVAPGTPGMEHRIGGLEKQDITGHVSYDPLNHQKMVQIRAKKMARVAQHIPPLEPAPASDLLAVGWGGTYGSLRAATEQLQVEGRNVHHTHFNYIHPLPPNVGEVLSGHKRIVVCELNNGQFAAYLQSLFPHLQFHSYTKVQGLPFTVAELTEEFSRQLKSIPL